MGGDDGIGYLLAKELKQGWVKPGTVAAKHIIEIATQVLAGPGMGVCDQQAETVGSDPGGFNELCDAVMQGQ